MQSSKSNLRKQNCKTVKFPTTYEAVLARVHQIDPIKYGRTRNYIDGAVTYLSPYISRGVISTKQVLDITLDRGFNPKSIEKFIQELVWREYWQEIWWANGKGIDQDLRSAQKDVLHTEMPTAILGARTGIHAIDQALEDFYQTGYLHNHVRMYLATITCNVGKSHWLNPAKWMYFHLLDGDWASNALSWQWVAGTNSKRKYLANQENINRFCHTQQRGTFLDQSYEAIAQMACPEQLQQTTELSLHTHLPAAQPLQIDPHLPTLLYTSYQLDPNWMAGTKANRILILEPSHFEAYPVSEKVIDFILALSKNIPTIQVFTGAFEELIQKYNPPNIHFKKHPFTTDFQGTGVNYDKIFSIRGDHPSFFRYWNKGKKERNW